MEERILKMTMADTGEGESCPWWLVIGGGVVTFVLVNYITDLLVPASASNTRQQRWKWRNVATSFIHSLITGLWALAAFYKVAQHLFSPDSTRKNNNDNFFRPQT